MVDLSPEVHNALRIATAMIDAGIPVFAAAPCPAAGGGTCDRPGHANGAHEFDLPAKWQLTVPSKVWLERWRPGWALAAVGGHAADFLDEDPRNGGTPSVDELRGAGQWPTVYAVAETPSGGQHYLIAPSGERKVTGLLPGLDYQGGAADGQGRGFVWIAPTVKRSKVDGQPRAYRWAQEPDLEWLADWKRDERGAASDPSLDGLRLRIAGYRAKRTERMESARERSHSAAREFTPAQMEQFLELTAAPLRTARVGEIEERANAYACALSHFVPSMLSVEQAFDRIATALGSTAYDPTHPASGWEADKFLAVLGDVGGRAPADWHAVATPATAAQAEAQVTGDEVTALLAEMLTADDLASRQPPRYMIEGLLQFDSESWLIGEPGSKKSFVALDMAGHVATGQPWQGRRVNPALVVFIVAEGAGGSAGRVKAWQKTHGSMGDRIRFLPRPVQSADLSAWAVLVAACRRLREALDDDIGMLVVLDTQARVTVGLKENDATDMGVFIDAIGAIRAATGGCVLTVHHTGRKGGDARGSSAIDGAQTTELKVVKDADMYGRLITEKQKDIVEADPIPLKFEHVDLGLDGDGRPVGSLVLAAEGSWGAGQVDGEGLDGLRDVDAVRSLNEPADWTVRLIPNPKQMLVRRILQAMAELGGETGRTEASLRKAVVQSWYPKGEGRGQGRLRVDTSEAGWGLAWRQCLEARTASGEPVVAVLPGPRFSVDPMVTRE